MRTQKPEDQCQQNGDTAQHRCPNKTRAWVVVQTGHDACSQIGRNLLCLLPGYCSFHPLPKGFFLVLILFHHSSVLMRFSYFAVPCRADFPPLSRSEEHTSEL